MNLFRKLNLFPFGTQNTEDLGFIGASPTARLVGVILASAALMAPTNRMHHVSGTAACTLITLPYAGFIGDILFIPDAAFTGATGGVQAGLNYPIGKAFTAVVGKTLTMTFDGALWYPNYIA